MLKKSYCTILILLFCFTHGRIMALGGGGAPSRATTTFELLLSIDQIDADSPEYATYQHNYQDLLVQFQSKKAKWNNDKRILEHLFYKVHRTYLKQYKPLQSFDATLKDGIYGCLTGTIIYALFLEDLGYSYELMESNYHIVVIVKTADKRYLFESTDPEFGFMSKETEIVAKLHEMEKANQGSNKKGSYQFTTTSINKVHLSNLVGLQLYNMAVVAYNKQAFFQAAKFLNQAKKHYSSSKLEEFSTLLNDQLNQQFTATQSH